MVVLLKRHRGLSNIVTSAILLTSVAVIGSSMIAWSNSNLKVFETSLANTTASNTNQINENVLIENVVFCANCATASSQNVVNVTLTNIGKIPVKISQITINGTAISSYYYTASPGYYSSSCPPPSGTATCLPTTIMPGNSYLVSAYIAASSPPLKSKWVSKEPDTIVVTTARGSIFTTQGAP